MGGYQVNGGPLVPIASKVGPSSCDPVTYADVTVRPFETAVLVRVFLRDVSCNDVYFSDGNHARVTPSGTNSFHVVIMDSGGDRESSPGLPRSPNDFSIENFSVDVVMEVC